MCTRPSFCTFVSRSLLPVLCFQPQHVTLLIGQNVLEMAHATAHYVATDKERPPYLCFCLDKTRGQLKVSVGMWGLKWADLSMRWGHGEEAGRHCSLLLSHKWMGRISGAPQSSGCLLSGDILHAEATSSFHHSDQFTFCTHFPFLFPRVCPVT